MLWTWISWKFCHLLKSWYIKLCNRLPDNKIVDFAKLSVYMEQTDILNVAKMMGIGSKRVESIVEDGECVSSEHFCLCPW